MFKAVQNFLDKRRATLLSDRQSAPVTAPIQVPARSEAAAAKSEGNAALAAGDLEAAVNSYRRAVELAPQDPLAHLNLGFGLLEMGQHESARASLQAAIAIDNSLHDAHYLLGRSYREQGDLPAAQKAFATSVAKAPNFEFGWRDLGAVQEQQGDKAAALRSYEQACLVQPDNADSAMACAKLMIELEQYAPALNWVERLERLRPDDGAVQVARANALYGLKRYDDALVLADRMLQINANYVPMIMAKGNVYLGQKKFTQALVMFEKARQLVPDLVNAMVNSTVAYQGLDRHEDALRMINQALSTNATSPEVISNFGGVLLSMGQVDQSIDMLQQGLGHSPGNAPLHWNLALALLTKGDLLRGWQEYEWRVKAKPEFCASGWLSTDAPLWTGKESLAGKTVVLFHEQGLGDSLQFIRYAMQVGALAQKVYLHVPESLAPLVKHWEPTCQVLRDSDLMPKFDYKIALMSLPLAFGTTADTIPAPIPYLQVEAGLVAQWGQRLGAKQRKRIGLVWSGSTTHDNDRNRSLRLEALRPWLKIDADFICLQKELREVDRHELAHWGERLKFVGDELHSFADTAALAQHLDLIVTVDTSVAHLVGAFGRPVWIMLAKSADWRWMQARTDSPWYPTARLFRQETQGSWQPVLDKIETELQAFIVAGKRTAAELPPHITDAA